MFEALSLSIFAGVIYFCLVIVPNAIEFFRASDSKKAFSKAQID